MKGDAHFSRPFESTNEHEELYHHQQQEQLEQA